MSEAPSTLDIFDILKLLPHRPPFLLVDRVIEWETGKRCVGLKNVTINEPFFQGHFPGHPIMPAVLIIEAMAQAGGVLLMNTVGDPLGKLVYFSGIDNARFRQPVIPGDQVRVNVSKIHSRKLVWKFQGRCEVDGKVVAEAVYTAMILDK